MQEEKVRIDLFYVTRMFKLKENEKLDYCNTLMSPSFPDNPYGVLIQTIEDHRYFVTFSGYANEKAPQTDGEFYNFAKTYQSLMLQIFLTKLWQFQISKRIKFLIKYVGDLISPQICQKDY